MMTFLPSVRSFHLFSQEMRDLMAEYDENLSASDILYGRGGKGFTQEALQKTAKMYLFHRESKLSPNDTLNDIENHRRKGRNKENEVKFKTKCKMQKQEYAIDDIDGHIRGNSKATNSFTLYPASKQFNLRTDGETSNVDEVKKEELKTSCEPDKGKAEMQEKTIKEENAGKPFPRKEPPEEVLGDERILNMTFFTDELKSQNIVQETSEECDTANNQEEMCHTPSDFPTNSICSACAILKQLDEYERNHYVTKTRAQELTELRKLIFQTVDHKIGCKKMRKDIFNKNLEDKNMPEVSAEINAASDSSIVPLAWAKETLRKVGYARALEFIALSYEEKLRKFKNWMPEFMKHSKTRKKQKTGARRCKARNRGILRRYPHYNNSQANWKIEGLHDPFYYRSNVNAEYPGKVGTLQRNSLSNDSLFKLTRNNSQGFNLFSDVKIDDEACDDEEIDENVPKKLRNFSKFPENLDHPLKQLSNDALQNTPTCTNQQTEWECHMLSCFPPHDKLSRLPTPTSKLLFENYEEDGMIAGIDKKMTAGPPLKYSWTTIGENEQNRFLDDEMPFSYPPPPSPEEPETNEYNSDQAMRIVNLFGTMEAEINSIDDDMSHCNQEQTVSLGYCHWSANDGYASPEDCDDYSIVTTPDPSSDEASDSDSDGSTDSLDTVIIKEKHDDKTLNEETTQLCEADEKELARIVAQEIINNLEDEIYAVIHQNQNIDLGDSQK